MAKANSPIVGAQIILMREDNSTEEYMITEPFGEFRWKKDYILDEKTGKFEASRRTEFRIIGDWENPEQESPSGMITLLSWD